MDKIAYYGLPIQSPLIWQCNTYPEDIPKTNHHLLAVQLWMAWSKINFHILENMPDVLDQVIWYNHHIKRANKMWGIQSAIDAGMHRIHDIYNTTTSTFATYDQLTNKFGYIMDVVTYHKIIHSIPQYWKILLRQRVTGEKTDTGLTMAPKSVKFMIFLLEIN